MTSKRQTEFDVVVIGAGIVGASAALWSQKSGSNVLLIDEKPPASVTSYGPACSIATYGCVPVNNPAIPRNLLKMLFHKDAVQRIDIAYVLRNLPWAIQFLKNCKANKVRKISDALGGLLKHTYAGLDPLIADAKAHDLISACGFMNVFSTEKSFAASRAGQEVRRRNGVSYSELNEHEIRELEPSLQMPIKGAYHYEDVKFVLDPQALVQRFVDELNGTGGKWLQSKVVSVEIKENAVAVVLENGQSIVGKKVVVAAGAFSKRIEGSGAEDLPLDTERGYHILFKSRRSLVSRPVGWVEGGFYATPMNHGLRLAGTEEIAGVDAPKTQSRIDYLKRRAHQMFGDVGEPDDDWLGYRPTMPDALPVIGYSQRSNNVIFAFGHQHIGLTLGGITGKLVSELALNQTPSVDISAFSARRFL